MRKFNIDNVNKPLYSETSEELSMIEATLETGEHINPDDLDVRFVVKKAGLLMANQGCEEMNAGNTFVPSLGYV